MNHAAYGARVASAARGPGRPGLADAVMSRSVLKRSDDPVLIMFQGITPAADPADRARQR